MKTLALNVARSVHPGDAVPRCFFAYKYEAMKMRIFRALPSGKTDKEGEEGGLLRALT